jgi:nitrogen-specific signal transduction histidine kinase
MPTPASALDELLRLLDAGDVAAAREVARRLQRTHVLASQVAAEVLHEVRQPLLGIKAYAQLAGEPPQGAPETRRTSQVVLAQVERIEHIISDYTRLVSESPPPRERLSLAGPVQAARAHFALLSDASRVHVEVEVQEDVQVEGNGRLLEQLTLNLLSNARDALGAAGGQVKVVVGREGALPALLVADWGPGVPPELRERIFEPYVSGRGRGSGLGLAVCRRIAQEHRASIALAPPGLLADLPPPTTVFRVLFPAAGAAPARRRRLLVVDDEAIIRSVFEELMGRECEVVTADSAEAALQHLSRGRFDVVVADKNLPGRSGLELAREARRLDARSRVILMTGHPSLVTAQEAMELGVLDYLLKPFDEIRDVRDALRRALAAAEEDEARPPSPAAPAPAPAGALRWVDVYEDEPESARSVVDALMLLGLQPRLLSEAAPSAGAAPPVGVVVSWDFAPARGKQAVALGRAAARGAPFVVLCEHLSMDTTLEALRGGAVACLPRMPRDVRGLSRELQRALQRPRR